MSFLQSSSNVFLYSTHSGLLRLLLRPLAQPGFHLPSLLHLAKGRLGGQTMESQSKSSWMSSAGMRCIGKFLVGIMCCWFICAWCPGERMRRGRRFIHKELILPGILFYHVVLFVSPVIVGPVLLIWGMCGYPGGPIMDMLCLESMQRFPVEKNRTKFSFKPLLNQAMY